MVEARRARPLSILMVCHFSKLPRLLFDLKRKGYLYEHGTNPYPLPLLHKLYVYKKVL